ncbi:MAG TPA: hypothetical protein VIL30_20070 [Ramlibacter sp.]|jgi:hypothetical protein
MEIATVGTNWLTWMATGAVGMLALAVLARGLEAVIDLDRG